MVGDRHSIAERDGRRVVVWLATVLLASALIGIATDQLLRPDAFQVENIRVSGEFVHVRPQAVEQRVLPYAQGNFFAVDIDRIERVAESIPWVHSATVRREWPGTIHVVVGEQRALARWGETAWVNSEGEVVELPIERDLEVLPVLHGPPDASRRVVERYRQWGALLAGSGVQIKSLTLSARRAWTMQIRVSQAVTVIANEPSDALGGTHSLTLVLGRHDVDARLTRFARVLSAVPGPHWTRAQRIDLRYPNGFAVKWNPGVEYAPSSTPSEQSDDA